MLNFLKFDEFVHDLVFHFFILTIIKKKIFRVVDNLDDDKIIIRNNIFKIERIRKKRKNYFQKKN